MKNGADIAYRENIRLTLANTLEKKQRGADFSKYTVNGLKMAIAYLDSIKDDILNERQLFQAVRLAHYRGKKTDYRSLLQHDKEI